MNSLHNRAIAAGLIWACIFAIASTFGLASYLNQLAISRFDQLQDARHQQVIVALINSEGDPEGISKRLTDTNYQNPFSGVYWQIKSPEGKIYVSRSLVDQILATPNLSDIELTHTTISGPFNQELRSTIQQLSFDNNLNWVVQTAASTTQIKRDQQELLRRLNIGILFSVCFATLGAFLLVFFALRPLAQLREEVSARWNEDGALDAKNYPREIQPLVDDINTLLDRNREIISRSRRQAADLAHALKTPSAIMRNELEALQAAGEKVSESVEALDRLDGQLKRSFARMRAQQGSTAEQNLSDLTHSMNRMVRAFTALSRNNKRDISAEIHGTLIGLIDRQDFEEILGNLLDNALKWSKTKIRLRTKVTPTKITMTIEDDGPGIPATARDLVLEGGQRLDEQVPGTGLGLSIAKDLVEAYGGELTVGSSDMFGGASVSFTVKPARETRIHYA